MQWQIFFSNSCPRGRRWAMNFKGRLPTGSDRATAKEWHKHVPTLNWGDPSIRQWWRKLAYLPEYSKWLKYVSRGPQTSSSGITWKLVRNANYPALLQTSRDRSSMGHSDHVLTSPPGNPKEACYSWGATAYVKLPTASPSVLSPTRGPQDPLLGVNFIFKKPWVKCQELTIFSLAAE